MAPKRQRKKNIAVENVNKYENILISDVLCPICRSILIEPVTLPCKHGFCFSCFNGTMENNSLTCPLCRIRIGSWLRTARKENKVINDTLWQTLLNKFPNEIQKKKDGKDIETNEKVTIKLADPGEIRREYEIQLAKEQFEKHKEDKAEEQASKLVIERILKEEQEKIRQNEEKLRSDEVIAKKLAKELSDAGPSNTTGKVVKKNCIDRYLIHMKKQKNDNDVKNSILQCHDVQNKQSNHNSMSKSHTNTILNINKDKTSCSTAYKHLLLTRTLQREETNSNGSDSGDSIKQEMRYFKPIRSAPKSVPKLLSDGNISSVPLIKVPAVLPKLKHAAIKKPITLNSKALFNKNSAFANVNISPQTIMEIETICKNDENGHTSKQYYSQKQHSKKEIKTNISNPSSPVLGFEKSANKTNILSALVNSLSANVNGESSAYFKNVINNNNAESKQQIYSKSMFDQEKNDLEFARKLNEELNNPRCREYVTRSQHKTSKVPKGNCRKRQVKLDELVTPKKFKI